MAAIGTIIKYLGPYVTSGSRDIIPFVGRVLTNFGRGAKDVISKVRGMKPDSVIAGQKKYKLPVHLRKPLQEEIDPRNGKRRYIGPGGASEIYPTRAAPDSRFIPFDLSREQHTPQSLLPYARSHLGRTIIPTNPRSLTDFSEEYRKQIGNRFGPQSRIKYKVAQAVN